MYLGMPQKVQVRMAKVRMSEETFLDFLTLIENNFSEV